MIVAVAYVKTSSSHLPRITVKAEKSSIRTAGDSVRIEPSISNRRARLAKNISDDRVVFLQGSLLRVCVIPKPLAFLLRVIEDQGSVLDLASVSHVFP